MEKSCYRCGAPVNEEAPFCPGCGAPQIRVSSQFGSPEPQSAAPESVAPESGAPAPPLSAPASFGPVPIPGEIQWKIFLRTAWPIAALAGSAARLLDVLGLLVILPLSVVLGVWVYRKRHLGALRAGQGARLGMAMGMISFIVFAAISAIAVYAVAEVRQEVLQSFNQAVSRSADPQARAMLQSLINSPQGFALVIGLGLLLAMMVFLVFTAITGAVVASTLGHKKP